MKKSERISAFVASLGADAAVALDPCYQGYFTCFNEQRYYEAHDVLEHLWLQGRDENYAFFKGLIQVAGAFVHLQKQYLRPEHPKDGRRLRPAVRLFHLAAANLEPYGRAHLQLDLEEVHALCSRHVEAITASDFQQNPWSPARAPQLHLLTAA
jgi:predicted metal-dependent hydrolase